MTIIIIKKMVKNYDKNIIFTFTNYILILNIFILKLLNQLSHNKKVNRLLITNFLFDLLDHYFLNIIIKIINITLLKTKFLLILSN